MNPSAFRRPLRIGAFLAILLPGSLGALAAEGDSVRARYLSPEEMALKAPLVVRVAVEQVTPRLHENGIVYTDALCSVRELWRGACSDARIEVRQAGGRLGEVETELGPRPDFQAGDEWVLCLARPAQGWWTVTGLIQGAFRIDGPDAVRDLRAISFTEPPPASVVSGRETLPVAELRARLGAAPAPVPPLDSRSESPARGADPATAGPRRPAGPPSAPQEEPPSRRLPFGLILAAVAILLAVAWRRRAARKAAPLLLLFSLLNEANPAIPFNWTPQGAAAWKWNLAAQTPAALYQNGEVVFRLITAGPYAIPAGDLQWAVVNAAQTWEDSPESTLGLVRGPDITTGPSYDQDFSIGFSDASENTQWGSNLAGASGLGGLASVIGGFIQRARVCFNSTQPWDGDDLEGTALHEIGHTMAFQHTPHAQSRMSYVGSWDGTSFSTKMDHRLTGDDHMGFAWLYPPPGYAASRGTLTGSVTLAAANVHKAQIGVFDTAGLLVATTLSNLGVYKVEGLPPGTYTLRAFPTFLNSDPPGLYQQEFNLPWTSTAVTAFGTTAADDAVAVVSAGSSTTANLVVQSGLPTMRVTDTVRRTGAATWGLTAGQVLRLRQGEAGRFQVIGIGLPNTIGDLAEFTLTGGGITLSNLAFSAASTTASAQRSDFPYVGARGIAYDVAVDVAATPGIRALVLRHALLPERTLVLGLIEVSAVGTLSAAAGASTPPAGAISPSLVDKRMLQATLAAGATEPVRLRGWTVTHSGTGSAALVSAVRIVHDADGDGAIDAGEPVVASGTFSGSTAVMPSAFTVPAGASRQFLVIYDFGAGVVNGTTYAASLTALASTGVDSVRAPTLTGLPVAGSTQTVDTTPPVAGTVNDGAGADISFQTSLTTITANWSGFADAESGITGYEWAIGTTAGGTQTQGFVSVGLVTTATNGSLSLSSGTVYYASVRAVNGAGQVSSVASSDGVLADNSAPVAGTVSDGLGVDIAYQASLTTISANWTGFSHASGITGYEWAIGTSIGGTQVQGYASLALATNAANASLALSSGQIYYVTVRATTGSAQQVTSTSNGVTVDTSVPVAGTVNDGAAADIGFQSSLTTITANWSGFSDAQSGIAGYEWAIGTTAGGTQVQGFVSVALLTNASNSSLALSSGQIYYVTVRATNGAGLQVSSTSNGVTVDASAPTVGAVNDGGGADIDLQVSATTILANWSGFSDAGSGITGYEWAIGTTAGGTQVQGFASVALLTNASNSSLALSSGTTYYVTVRATNGAGLQATQPSDGVLVDASAPVAGMVNDGAGSDIAAQASLTTISANWSGFSDAQSGITGYEWAIGTTPGGTQVQGFVSVALLTNASNSSLALTSGAAYYVTVRATNGTGLQATSTSNGVMVDSSAPAAGTVNDGAGGDIDLQASLTTISANWSGFSDAQSGIVGYEWAIGTTAGGTQVQGFVSVGLTTSASNGSLVLANGATYFVTVRATNGAGLQVAPSSDGVLIDSTPPIGGTVNDGAGADIDVQSSVTTIFANWFGFSDPQTGITGYEWALGTAAGTADLMPFTPVGLATSASTSAANLVLSLPIGGTVFASVRATNGAGAQTSVPSDGVTLTTADGSPPSPPPGFLAFGADASAILEWVASASGDTAFYRAWHKPVGSPWTAATLADGLAGTSATIPGLVNGTTYDFLLKAVDASGNESTGLFAAATPQPAIRIQGVGGSFLTVQAAINAAASGQTVLLGPGTFIGDLTLNPGVSLAGTDPKHTVIQGSGAGDVITVAGVNGTDPLSTISDLTVQTGVTGIAGGSANLRLLRVLIHHMTGSGVTAGAAGQLEVVNGTIMSNGAAGISSLATTVVRNTVVGKNGGVGIDVPAVSTVTYTISYLNALGNFAAGVGGAGNGAAAAVFTDETAFVYTEQPSSPTIDAGDPLDAFAGEPAPNGSRINQGAFGNTPWAAVSPAPAPPPAAGGGGGGGGGCGATGLEFLALALALRLISRRRVNS